MFLLDHRTKTWKVIHHQIKRIRKTIWGSGPDLLVVCDQHGHPLQGIIDRPSDPGSSETSCPPYCKVIRLRDRWLDLCFFFPAETLRNAMRDRPTNE